MHILDEIIANKKREISELKSYQSIDSFRTDGMFWEEPGRSLKQTLLLGDTSGIIAEFKRKSPSKGWLKPRELEVDEVVLTYNDYGAAGISVLTDEAFFGGELEDLIKAREITDVPLLRKDFIIDEWQIAESKANGADVILLIAACLSPAEVRKLGRFARSLGLEVLLELHDETELDHVCEEVDMVGVNNRNLKTFEVDINTSLKLIRKIQDDIPVIAESGISNPATITQLGDAGFSGFLIGETFMKSANPGNAFREFVAAIK